MDIAALNIQSMQIDNIRLNQAPAVHSPENFAEILRRASSASETADNESPAARRPGESPVDKSDKLFQLCLDLETFLVKNLLTSMRNTVQKSGLIDEGFAGKMYEDMLYDEYARDFTRSAGFGLAEQAYNQLKRLQ